MIVEPPRNFYVSIAVFDLRREKKNWAHAAFFLLAPTFFSPPSLLSTRTPCPSLPVALKSCSPPTPVHSLPPSPRALRTTVNPAGTASAHRASPLLSHRGHEVCPSPHVSPPSAVHPHASTHSIGRALVPCIDDDRSGGGPTLPHAAAMTTTRRRAAAAEVAVAGPVGSPLQPRRRRHCSQQQRRHATQSET